MKNQKESTNLEFITISPTKTRRSINCLSVRKARSISFFAKISPVRASLNLCSSVYSEFKSGMTTVNQLIFV